MIARIIRSLAGLALLSIPLTLVAAPPTLTLSAQSTSVNVGDTTVLTWSSIGADSCRATGDWIGNRPVVGTFNTYSLSQARTYEYRMRCTNSSGYVDDVVFVNAGSSAVESYNAPLVAQPTVLPYLAAFSQGNFRWRLNFRLNSLGATQGLVSMDESGQATAGHTTLSVNPLGYVVLRHQARSSGSYLTQSQTRVIPGRDYEVSVEMRQGIGVTLLVNGQREGESNFAYGTQALTRDIVLGGSCEYCNPGTNAPVRFPIDGTVSFALESLSNVQPPPNQPPIEPPTPLPPVEPPTTSGALFSSGSVSGPTVFPYRAAFARNVAQWRLQFRLNSVGNKQGLVSYDELGQRSGGHTSIKVLEDGRLQLKQQDGGRKTLYLHSTSRVVAGREYTVALKFTNGGDMELWVDGVREGRSTNSFGTSGTTRPLVVGGYCGLCEPGTTAPTGEPINGVVSLEIFDSLSDQIAPPVIPPSQPPTVPPNSDLFLDFAADRTNVSAGESVTLSWTASNASYCYFSGDWTGTPPFSGSRTLAVSTSQRDFQVTCINDIGDRIIRSVSVQVGGSVPTQPRVTLRWDAPTINADGSPVSNLTGYNVRYGTSPGVYPQKVEINSPQTLQTTLQLAPGSYSFVVTAVNAAGLESSYSAPVSANIN